MNCRFVFQTFIRCCLQYKKEDRAEVLQLYYNEYLKPKNQKNQQQTTSTTTTVVAPTSFSQLHYQQQNILATSSSALTLTTGMSNIVMMPIVSSANLSSSHS